MTNPPFHWMWSGRLVNQGFLPALARGHTHCPSRLGQPEAKASVTKGPEGEQAKVCLLGHPAGLAAGGLLRHTLPRPGDAEEPPPSHACGAGGRRAAHHFWKQNLMGWMQNVNASAPQRLPAAWWVLPAFSPSIQNSPGMGHLREPEHPVPTNLHSGPQPPLRPAACRGLCPSAPCFPNLLPN